LRPCRPKAAPLFRGARGKPPIKVEVVADAIVAIANGALALGPNLIALEINPLAVMPAAPRLWMHWPWSD